MVLPPGAAPEVTTPVLRSIAATVGLLLVHVPPEGEENNGDITPPEQSVVTPSIAVGNGLTVTVVVW
jgi:hypothetical protein